ncbi:Flp pilus assembly protein CpaB [Rhodopila sp.]|uniref:Flp pilus assembly protein CpaB n=1 Tax=Rhodopila sp. TaxID=2480087 RepID=UPI003D151C23
MLLRIALFALMAAGLAGFGAVAWISTRSPPPPSVAAAAVAPPVKVSVLAAAHTLRPGVLLKPDDLTAAVVAQSAVPEGARLDTPANRADLLGAMLRRNVLAGEVLLPIHVMRAGDRGFLAAVLGPGMRATTVGVDAVTGSAGLIWPGDHVDLILTETIDNPAAPLGRRVAGETVLHNVRVIAIDQELMQGATAPTPGSTFNASQGRTVTLEVSPEDAERVAVATRLGHLSLSVISADTPSVPVKPASVIQAAAPAPVTWGGDVSTALRAGPKGDATNAMLHVYEGSAEGKEFHFQ